MRASLPASATTLFLGVLVEAVKISSLDLNTALSTFEIEGLSAERRAPSRAGADGRDRADAGHPWHRAANRHFQLIC